MFAVLIAVGLWFAALPARAEYREIEVSDPGRIEGQVKASGDVPKLPPQAVFKQKEYCGDQVPDERLVIGANGELRNAVVYLTDVKAGKAARLDQAVKVDNHKCAFVPHVLTATLGQTLEIHNSDPFLHDAHALLGSRTLFNVAILSGRTVRQPLLDAGLIHVNCNVRHTWMHAYMLVAEHPYHTVTDADGRFTLEGVPPGIWTLRVWHEMLGSVDEQVRLQPGETATRTIALEASADSER
jgi:plastocyanin